MILHQLAIWACNFKCLKPPTTSRSAASSSWSHPIWTTKSTLSFHTCQVGTVLCQSMPSMQSLYSRGMFFLYCQASNHHEVIHQSLAVETKFKSGKIFLLNKIEKALEQKEEDLIASFITTYKIKQENKY